MERPAVVEYGEDLLLTCTASGGPNNMFRWVKDGDDITGSTDSMLNITGVTADEGGLYECVVNNEAGNSSADINIYGRTCISLNMLLTPIMSCLYTVAPRFITEPQSVEEFTGMPVNLTCSADGFPAPVIMWTFQDMPYTDGIVNSTMSTSTFTESTIVIDNIMLSDGGDYQCIIDSDAIMVLRNSNATVAVIDGMCVYTYISLGVEDAVIHWSCKNTST